MQVMYIYFLNRYRYTKLLKTCQIVASTVCLLQFPQIFCRKTEILQYISYLYRSASNNSPKHCHCCSQIYFVFLCTRCSHNHSFFANFVFNQGNLLRGIDIWSGKLLDRPGQQFQQQLFFISTQKQKGVYKNFVQL